MVFNDQSKDIYLYTTGFFPSIKTFPGISIPRPVLVRPELADSGIDKICQEIISLTKLDWNNTFPYRRFPVTLSISRKVGNILSESEAKNVQIDPHYYYYM